MVYEINIKIEVSSYSSGIACSFWFKNPITNEESLVIESMRSGESSMEFVERVKLLINTNEFLKKVKSKIIKDIVEDDKKNKLKVDLETVKKELNGMTFSVTVDID